MPCLAACGLFGSLHGPALVILTVGDDEYGARHVFLIGEAPHTHRDGGRDVRALHLYHLGRYRAEKHLGTHIVARDGQLRESLSGIDDESHLVVVHFVHHARYQHLRLLQTVRSHILRQHRVRHIQSYDGLYAAAFTGFHLGAELRTGQCYDEEEQAHFQQCELQLRSQGRVVYHHALHQRLVSIFLQTSLLTHPEEHVQHGKHSQQEYQIKILRIFKSKHVFPFTVYVLVSWRAAALPASVL